MQFARNLAPSLIGEVRRIASHVANDHKRTREVCSDRWGSTNVAQLRGQGLSERIQSVAASWSLDKPSR